MSDYQIDGPPADAGENPLIHFLQREFSRLHKRVDALDPQRRGLGQRMQSARPNVALNANRAAPQAAATSPSGAVADAATKTSTTAKATLASGPLWELQTVLAEIAQATQPLTDLQIVQYRDDCKHAIMDLRNGVGDGSVTDTQGTIAYQLKTHDAFIEVIGVLLNAARSRDPYAAQLQIG